MRQAYRLDSPPPKHTHRHKHTQTHSKSNNVTHGEKNLWLIIVCVYWLLISTKSTLICLYNHSISSSLLLSFFFCRNLSLSHKKGEDGLRVLLLSDLIRNWWTNMVDQQTLYTSIFVRAGWYSECVGCIQLFFCRYKIKQHYEYRNGFNVLFIWPLNFLKSVSLE